MKKPMTPAAREAFRLYLSQWQERLGLQDWRVILSDKPSRHCAELRAVNYAGRLATVALGTGFGEEAVTDLTLEDTAVHELLHLLLYEWRELLLDTRAGDDVRESAEHRVIHALCNLLVHGK